MSTTEESAASLLSEAKSGPISRIQLRASEITASALRGVRAAMKAVGMRGPDRGPDPDYTPQDDDIRRLAGIIERLSQRQPDNGYHEGPKESGLKAIIVGCTVTLLSAMVIAAFMLTNEFAAFKAQVNEWQRSTDRRLEMLERRP